MIATDAVAASPIIAAAPTVGTAPTVEEAIASWLEGRFGDVKRSETGGKGLEGVMEKSPDYFNPFLDILEGR